MEKTRIGYIKKIIKVTKLKIEKKIMTIAKFNKYSYQEAKKRAIDKISEAEMELIKH